MYEHTQAQLLLDMWSVPGPGIEPVSPALAGRFLSTVPPEKSYNLIMYLSPIPVFEHWKAKCGSSDIHYHAWGIVVA